MNLQAEIRKIADHLGSEKKAGILVVEVEGAWASSILGSRFQMMEMVRNVIQAACENDDTTVDEMKMHIFLDYLNSELTPKK